MVRINIVEVEKTKLLFVCFIFSNIPAFSPVKYLLVTHQSGFLLIIQEYYILLVWWRTQFNNFPFSDLHTFEHKYALNRHSFFHLYGIITCYKNMSTYKLFLNNNNCCPNCIRSYYIKLPWKGFYFLHYHYRPLSHN